MLTTSRVLLSFVTAVIIAATAYLCAWLNLSTIRSNPYDVELTRYSLKLLHQEIEADKESTGNWPARLSDLGVVQKKGVPEDKDGNPVDTWGRPLQYHTEADGFELYSYGPDGPEGKWGQAGYVYLGKPDPKTERPTLLKFTISDRARPIQIVCILTGVIAFPLCLLQGKEPPGYRLSLGWFLLQIGITAVFAIFAALVMSVFYFIPSGH